MALQQLTVLICLQLQEGLSKSNCSISALRSSRFVLEHLSLSRTKGGWNGMPGLQM